MNDQQALGVSTGKTDVFTGEASVHSAAVDKEEHNQGHIKTDHLLLDLKQRTISGGVVTMSSQAAKFGLSVASTVILARLLTPRDFGLVAMVMAVTGFLAIFLHAGLATPTVQREQLACAQVSNLFWINPDKRLLRAVVLVGSSPAFAQFYHDSRITP